MSGKDRRFRASESGTPRGPAALPGAAVPRFSIAELHALAVQHQQAGRLAEAERLHRQILLLNPRHIDSLHLLGGINHQQGRHDAAIELIGKAIALNGRIPAFHSNLAAIYRTVGRLDEAIAAAKRALALKPDFVEAHINLGISHLARDQRAEAIAALRRAVALKPDSVEAHFNLGNALYAEGRRAEALAAFHQVQTLRPDFPDAHLAAGGLLLEQGKPEEALAAYRRALALAPDRIAIPLALAHACLTLGQVEEAIASLRQGLALDPACAEAHAALGDAFQAQGDAVAAIAAYETAIAAQPDFAEAHLNLGHLLREEGKTEQAMRAYQRALAEVRKSLDSAATAEGREDEATATYRQALALTLDLAGTADFEDGIVAPDKLGAAITALRRALAIGPAVPRLLAQLARFRAQACDWSEDEKEAEQVADVMRRHARTVHPFDFLARSSSPADQLLCAQQWLGDLGRRAADFPHPRPKAPGPIRLGYLSADYREHPVGQVIPELIERHDRSRFAVTGYSYGPDDGGPRRRRLMTAFDRFVDLRTLDNDEAARRIHDDGIDILIDLTGHTANARLRILARHPAPLQVGYLGYPGTTGADFIDYALVDRQIAPPEEQPFFTERLVHLPHSYFAYDTHCAIAEPAPTRAACGLPERGFVFCCFNNSYKLTPAVFDIWMRLLRAVPDSVLWLIQTNPLVSDNLRREAQARAVAPERLVFATRLPFPEHLARHRLADLFLDTLPYNAHTTAADALWAGLPLVTCTGTAFPGRVAGSLLRAVGLPELITTTAAEYEALALALARSGARLAGLREKLALNRKTTPLFDMERLAADIETAYRRMWDLWCAGAAPRSFAVAAS